MDTAALPMAWGGLEQPFAVNVGNPHLVFFVPDAREVELEELGPRIENDPAFPERINVNVATYVDDRLKLRTFERGAGETLACGTGACASAVAAIATKRAQSPVQVDMTGGSLTIDWAPGQPIRMRGARDARVRRRARSRGAAMSVETITLGCRLNFAESETIARTAPAGEDWIVVNSCAVTNEAVRQTRQAIRQAHRRRPSRKILVTGCAAELDRGAFDVDAGGRSRRRKCEQAQ